MFLKKAVTLAIFVTYCWNALAGAWNSENNPENMARETNQPYEYNVFRLPAQGFLTSKPWADDYWPTYKRGLAQRWQGDLVPVQHAFETPEEFAIRSQKGGFFTEKELLFMSEGERNKLSPAEKYDIINGRYDYPLTNYEGNRTKPDAPEWEGICHGWAVAALRFKEPGKCEMVFGPGEAKIPFVTSDIKALLSLMQGNFSNVSSVGAGTRCNDKMADIEWEKSSHQNDINAGAFHVILANRIGLLNTGFVFDRTVDAEVWNQPVEGFRTGVVQELPPGPDAAPGTFLEVQVQTIVDYTEEVAPHTDPLNNGNRMGFVVAQPYNYILELDSAGNILGGKWLDKDYPDFVWSQAPGAFEGYFMKLKEVYNKSTGSWF